MCNQTNKYAKSGQCPVCGENDIEYGTYDIEGYDVNVDCYCEVCGAKFTEYYQLDFMAQRYIEEGKIQYNGNPDDDLLADPNDK